jgi:signal peptidase I
MMVDDSAPGPAADPGWYPDPSQVDTVRFWDGSQWTDQRAPMQPPSPERGGPSRRFWLALAAVVAIIAVAVAVVLITRGGSEKTVSASFAVPRTVTYTVPSGSMEPTYPVGDVLSTNLDAYADSEPAVGDVVVFHPPAGAESASECGVQVHGQQPIESGEACPKATSEESGQTFVKRIVAVGGDTLSIKEGHPVVNGVEARDQSYTEPCGAGYECNLPKTITIPKGEFFMLGDNRGESDDSRYWGPVPEEWVLGRVES